MTFFKNLTALPSPATNETDEPGPFAQLVHKGWDSECANSVSLYNMFGHADSVSERANATGLNDTFDRVDSFSERVERPSETDVKPCYESDGHLDLLEGI